MPRIGVKDLHVHELLEETDTSANYGEAQRIVDLIEVSVTPQVNSAELYADDRLANSISVLSSFDITIGVAELSPEIQAKLLGQEVDVNGGVFTSSKMNPPSFAVSFRAERSDGTYEYRQMFKVKFAPTDETYNTKGETPEFQTESITGISMPLQHNGQFNYKIVDKDGAFAETWFDEIHATGATVASPLP